MTPLNPPHRDPYKIMWKEMQVYTLPISTWYQYHLNNKFILPMPLFAYISKFFKNQACVAGRWFVKDEPCGGE